jgi:hypothetical protein
MPFVLAYNPKLWGFIAQSHLKALMVPVGFEMLDRAPAGQSTGPPVVEEDPMATKKFAA